MPEVTENEVLDMLDDFRDYLQMFIGAIYIFEALTKQAHSNSVDSFRTSDFYQAYLLVLNEMSQYTFHLNNIAKCVSVFYLKRMGILPL